MLRLVNWANHVQRIHVSEFFDTLVELFASIFDARLVTIWDYTPDNESLVLQASYPERRPAHASHIIPVRQSMTGLVFQTFKIESQDVTVGTDGRMFSNPDLAANLQLKSMYSVPIFTPGDRQEIRLVLNLGYGVGESPGMENSEIQLLADFIAICFEHRLYTRAVHIREEIAKVAASAAGMRSLFESLEDRITSRTHADIAQILRVDRQGNIIEEGRRDVPGGDNKLTPHEIKAIRETCVTKKQVYMERVIADDKADRFDCRLLAVPFLSTSHEPIGVLCCKEPQTAKGHVRAFSSIDLHALRTFVEMLSPSVERFARLERNRSLAVIRRVSRALEGSDEFEMRLQRTIHELCRALQCDIGSIYLREDDRSDVLMMRAAYGRNETLVGEARYRLGEGLTGRVAATGAIVNLRDDAEMNVQSWTGKYDGRIWGGDARDNLHSFLALPILSGKTIAGVLKLANIHVRPGHPDSFFSDEDVQLVRVVASFLGHGVKSDNLERARLLQFRLLAEASLQMQDASDEDTAITVLLAALEKSSVRGAGVALMNSDPSAPAFELGFGVLDADRVKLLAQHAERMHNQVSEEGFAKLSLQVKNEIIESHHFPIRIGGSSVGSLFVSLGTSSQLSSNEVLVLRAFHSQFEAAIERIRVARRAQELADEAVTRQRFVAAETVYLAAVHRLGHALDAVSANLDGNLSRVEVRENRLAFEETTSLKKTVEQLKTELKSSLNIVRADEGTIYDIHMAISTAVKRWNSDRGRRCRTILKLAATTTLCRLNPDAVEEIVNILLVNSEQAHAREAVITTRNDTQVEIDRSDGESLYIDAALCMEFNDNGIGIPPEVMEDIFLPTFTLKPRRFGTGLGLFIARMLARRGGGDLKAHKTRHGKGASFRLTLPVFEVIS